MVFYQDNFLTEEEFKWLDNISSKVSEDIQKEMEHKGSDSSRNRVWGKFNWNRGFFGLNDDTTIPSVALKRNIKPIMTRISDLIKEKSKLEPFPPLDDVFLIYSKDGYKVHRHTDNTYSVPIPEDLAKCHKAFIFCHNEWKEEWGGHLCFDGHEILPVPNRLVVFSVDESHWVNLVNTESTMIRKIFGGRWGRDD